MHSNTVPPAGQAAFGPIFAWVGGKRHHAALVVEPCKAFLQRSGGKLCSPFLGSGALERRIAGVDATGAAVARFPLIPAGDACRELLATYAAFQRPDAEISTAEFRTAFRYFADLAENMDPADAHRFVRDRWSPQDVSSALEAARFVWLVRCSFNRIWRVGRTGKMSTPVDRDAVRKFIKKLPSVEDIDRERAFARRLVLYDSWVPVVASADTGDLILADPPYAGGFMAYTAAGFPWEERVRYVRALQEAAARGVGILAFDSPEALPLFDWADGARDGHGEIHILTRSGRMSAKKETRLPTEELVVTAGGFLL